MLPLHNYNKFASDCKYNQNKLNIVKCLHLKVNLNQLFKDDNIQFEKIVEITLSIERASQDV